MMKGLADMCVSLVQTISLPEKWYDPCPIQAATAGGKRFFYRIIRQSHTMHILGLGEPVKHTGAQPLVAQNVHLGAQSAPSLR
jgi:hypothetical protein